MLVQSHNGVFRLLAALPDAWPEGQATGLRARGGFEVDIAWKNGNMSEVALRSIISGPCKIACGQKIIPIKTVRGKTYRLDGLLERRR